MTTLIRRPPLKRRVTAPRDAIGALVTNYFGPRSAPNVNPGVNTQIAAQTAGIKAAYADQQRQLAQQAERAQGFAGALGTLTAPDPAAIAAQYRQSADRLRGIGTGLTGAVATAQQEQADRSASEVARITGGLGNVGSYDIPALRNVAQLGGVLMPAADLEGQAANAFANASAQRAGSVGRIGQIAQEYLQKGSDVTAEMTSKIAALQMTRPQLYNEAVKAAQEGRRADFASLVQAYYLQNTLRKTGAEVTGRDPFTRLQTPEMRAAAAAAKAAAAEARRPDSSLSRTYGYVVDSNGRMIPGPNGKRQPVSKSTGGAGAGATHMQSKTINGNTVLFDPGSGNYYMPGDTLNAINPNTLQGQLDPGKLQVARARAAQGIQAKLYDPKDGDPDLDPKIIFAAGRADDVPAWVMLQALRSEALNHPDDKAWQNVLSKGWVGSKAPKPKAKKK